MSINIGGIKHWFKPVRAVFAVGIVSVVEVKLFAVKDVTQSNKHYSLYNCKPSVSGQEEEEEEEEEDEEEEEEEEDHLCDLDPCPQTAGAFAARSCTRLKRA